MLKGKNKLNMFDELTKYKNNKHFFFTANQELENVCDAPKNKSGSRSISCMS